ncbi:MAG TPA: succinylglutamate desuccinylase/aspartoacylase family protein, partial [Nitrospiria bacterium]|nr:succinylglutamate desuccinylase/aspartoacylase family protein [Nitrospiria bacterium]
MDDFTLGGCTLKRGERKRVTLEIARLYDFTETGIPIEVIHGRRPGPVLFICGAIHGDEINGVEIIKRLLGHKSLKKIRGTLIAVPIVNVFGFNTKSRYLPDRRDLNRSFPGSKDGSLASQLAHTFMQEVVSKSTHGIDLHTGAVPRSNLPQVRAFLKDPETERLARAFRVPVIINSNFRDGSLREAARERGIPMLLYEGGEALRFNEPVIR